MPEEKPTSEKDTQDASAALAKRTNDLVDQFMAMREQLHRRGVSSQESGAAAALLVAMLNH